MDKLKNILNPGKSKDDEVMYGSGQSDDPVHTGTGTQATGSNITDNPVSSSAASTGNTARDPVGQGGVGSVQHGSNPTSSFHIPGTFDDDDDVGSTSSIKSGLPGSNQASRVIGASETHDPLDTNKPLPREPTTGAAPGLESSATTGAGPHSSGLANRADPRVDSDLDSSRGLGSHGTMVPTGGVTGSSLPDRTTGNTDTTLDSGRSFPLGGAAAAGTTTSGPHDSSLANKADPRVDTDRNGSGALGSTSGYGTGTGPTVGSAHQGDLNRSDVGSTTGAITEESLPKAYGEDTWIHDHQKHGHEFVGDPCEHEPPAPGALHFTPGPHSLDTTNRLDPHVGGESIGGTPSSTTDTSASSTGHHHHHHGRDAALGAGAGAAGVAAYEGSSGVPSSATTESGHHGLGRDTALGAETGAAGAGAYGSSRDIPSGSSLERDRATAGPHQSDTMNELDPRVDPDLSKQQRTSGTTGATTGTTGLTSTSTTDPSIGQEHHPGRDAALGAAGGAAVYEGAKHHGRDVPEGTSTSGYANPYPPGSTTTGVRSGPTSSTTGTTPSTDPTSISKDHHYGRDAGLAGAGAGAAYEADKHLRGPHGDTAGTRSTDLASAQQPTTEPFGPGYQRDTGLIGAGTTGHHDTGYQPSPTSGVAGQPAAYDERNRPHESHTGRNAALGAAAGTAAVAGGEELSKKDLEREQKAAHEQELREQKAAHKQEEKAEKHHQHELEKAEKKHQHELEKAEKAHEKKHEHKEEPHEGEKKHHHGLLGKLFHRDKSDKELKEEEAARKEHSEQEFHPGAGTAAAGVGGVAADTAGLSEKEKHERAKEHDRNRLHKDPPPGFGQTEYAEAPTEGYASQVTGGTGTTALAQGEPVPQGSHATGFGNKVDPNVAGRGETVDSDRTRDSEGRVVEPHTGLPTNLQKGDGAGGTDSTPVHGFRTDHAGMNTSSGSGEGFGHLQDHPR